MVGTERNGREYADMRLLKTSQRASAYFRKPARGRALDQAWSEGCPVGPSLTRPESRGGKGARKMELRYGVVKSYSAYFLDQMFQRGRTDLMRELVRPTKRLPGEPLGKHDENWIPDKLRTRILVPPEMYALPRLLTSFVDLYEPKGQEPSEIRNGTTMLALWAFDAALNSKPEDATSLVVNFAERLAKRAKKDFDKSPARRSSKDKKQDPVQVILRALLSQGKLSEENCFTAYRKILAKAASEAPTLRREYSSMTPKERAKAGIANISI